MRALLTTLLFCFFLNNSLFANDDTINEFNISGLKRIDYDTVISYSGIEIGDTYTEEKGNEALKELFDTDLFSNIKIFFDDGVLNIDLQENPTINLIQFEGNKKIKDEDLMIEVSLKERSIYSRTKIKKDIERMLILYQRSGRLNTEINPTAEVLENNRVNITYEINESEIVEVTKIIIIGNDIFSARKIRSLMKTKQKNLLKFWTSADNYDPDRLEYDKRLIAEFYNNNGYPDFVFTSSIAQLVPKTNSFEIILSLSEGEKFNFGKINATSELKKLDTESVTNIISAKEGNLFNQSLISSSINTIKELASIEGYAFISIVPDYEKNNDDNTFDITFKVNEGPRVYVDHINISGNVRTIDNVIRRQLEMTEGDAYNKYALNLSKDKLRSLNYFSEVEITEEKTKYPDKLNVNIYVEEKNTGEASLGAGYSSQTEASIQLGLKEKNFLGKGQTANISANFGNTYSTYDISFTEPYFNNKKLSVKTDFYSSFSDPSSANYETEDLGIGLELGLPLASDKRLRGRYSIYTTKVKADSNASAYERLLAGTDTVSAIGYTFTYDKRNSPYKPNRGHIFKFTQDIAGLGGTSYYFKDNIEFNLYKQLSKRFIGAVKFSAGNLNGYNGKYAPITANFKLGGKSLRGFKYGKIGPISGTSYAGGQFFYLTSLETNFDLPIEGFDITSTFFIDAGTVWGLDERYGNINDNHNLRASLGVNFNWDSAIGPINIIYADAFKQVSTDTTDTIYFDIGYNF